MFQKNILLNLRIRVFFHLPLDKMIEKAYKLLRGKRIEQIGEGLYNVVGDHGTYTVARKMDGTVTCNCPGFISKNRCSHSLAVLMLSKTSKHRHN